MPQVYITKEIYDRCIKLGLDVTEYINKLVEDALTLKENEGNK